MLISSDEDGTSVEGIRVLDGTMSLSGGGLILTSYSRVLVPQQKIVLRNLNIKKNKCEKSLRRDKSCGDSRDW